MNFQVIAKRYAGALYAEYKTSTGSVKMWDELDALAKLQKDSPDFDSIIRSPLINDAEKKAVFMALKINGKLGESLYNFICLLIDKKRLMFLATINDDIKQFILTDKGEVEVEAVFAGAPDQAAKANLEKTLAAVTGKKIKLKEVIDPQVIGGVKVRLGSILYDATIKGQLEKLKASLV